jgi:hypothetical protein
MWTILSDSDLFGIITATNNDFLLNNFTYYHVIWSDGIEYSFQLKKR